MEQLDLPDERHDREPIREQREQEEGAEEREVLDHRGSTGLAHEVGEALDEDLEEALKTAGLLRKTRRREDREEYEHGHHEPRSEDRVRDGDVVPDRDR